MGRHAEPEAHIADRLVGHFGHALIIPAHDEGDDLMRALASVPPGPEGDVLLILVVNAAPEAPASVHERNAEVLSRLRQTVRSRRGDFSRCGRAGTRLPLPRRATLHIDRASPEHLLPSGQGVGWARKIGFDIALRLHRSRRLSSRWLHSTDADVILPHDYFERASAVQAPANAAALVYPFSHRGEEDVALARAVQLYEISLRYYVLGLASAGSHYAHHTIGSTIAVDAIAYAKVRGVPKRTAAEDFYLLGKLAKIGAVVPFGWDASLVERPRFAACPFRHRPRRGAHRAQWAVHALSPEHLRPSRGLARVHVGPDASLAAERAFQAARSSGAASAASIRRCSWKWQRTPRRKRRSGRRGVTRRARTSSESTSRPGSTRSARSSSCTRSKRAALPLCPGSTRSAERLSPKCADDVRDPKALDGPAPGADHRPAGDDGTPSSKMTAACAWPSENGQSVRHGCAR